MMYFKTRNSIEAVRDLRVSLVAIGLSLAFALTGCFRPERGEISAASFFNEEVKGRADSVTLIDGFSIPKSRFYSLSVCVKDKRTIEPLRGHRFEISGGQDTKTINSDASGCVQWSEEFEFDFLAGERYVPVRRVLTASGMHAGSLELKFAINPWKLSGQAELIDLTQAKAREKIPAGKLATDEEAARFLSPSGSQSTNARLFLSKLEIEAGALGQSGDAVSRMLKLDLKPSILVTNLNGERVAVPLINAKLQIEAAVLQKVIEGGSTTHHLVWSSSQPIPSFREEDRIRAEIPVRLQYGNDSNRFLLALRLSPVGAPQGLAPEEILYDIGNLSEVIGSAKPPATFVRSVLDGGFDYNKEVKALAALQGTQNPGQTTDQKPSLDQPSQRRSGGETPSQPNRLSQSAPSTGGQPQSGQSRGGQSQGGSLPSGVSQVNLFQVKSVKASFSKPENETSRTRTVVYSVTICLSDTSNGGRAPVDVNFNVTKPDGKSQTYRTRRDMDLQGCLQWEGDRISHRYYDVQHYISVPLKITHAASKWSTTVTLALNPWDRGNFYIDPVQHPELIRGNRTASDPTIKPRVLVDSIRFDAINERRYEVDQFLSLKIMKPFRLRIPVRVIRNDSIAEGLNQSPEALRPGVYLFNSAFFINTKDATGQPVQMVSAQKPGPVLVRLIGSELKLGQIEFEIPDERMFRARGSFVFEIKPVKEELIPSDDYLMKPLTAQQIETLIDRDALLVTPTFTSPMWIKDEAGFPQAIPNDELLRVLGRASGELASRETREALEPLVGLTVDQLVARAQTQERQYRERMLKERQLAEFVKNAHTEYVALTPANEARVLEQSPGLEANNKLIPVQNGLKALLEILNKPFQRRMGALPARYRQLTSNEPITQKTLLDLVNGEKPMDKPLALKFCSLLLVDMPKRAVPNGDFTESKLNAAAFLDNCAQDLTSAAPSAVLSFERKLRVFEVGSKGVKKEERQLGLQVGADVSFGRSRSEGVSWSAGFDPLALFDFLKVVPAAKFIPANIAALGVKVGVSKSWSDSTSVGEGGGFSSGTGLNMRQFYMDITLNKTESCGLVRVNPEFLKRHSARLALVNREIPKEKALEILSRGVMMCSAYLNDKPQTVRESYYMIGQGFFDDILSDTGTLDSQPWLLALRGARDYTTFLNLIAAKKTTTSQVQNEVDLGGFAIDQLETAYRSYQGMTYAAPGYYTFDPRAQRRERQQ